MGRAAAAAAVAAVKRPREAAESSKRRARMSSAEAKKRKEEQRRRTWESEEAIVVGGDKMRHALEWLPRGWLLQIKARLTGSSAGTKYKCYIDPSSGSRFYSKGEVLRFLNSGNICTPTSAEKNQFKASITDNVLAQIEHTPDGLPQGWIKETKFRKSKNGIKRDPYYTDPVNGYVFRSLKDANHYVETGELGIHVIKPRKSSISEMYSLEKESPLAIHVEERKSLRRSERFRHSTEEASTSNGDSAIQIYELPDKSQLPPPDNGFSTIPGSRRPDLTPSLVTESMEAKSSNKRKDLEAESAEKMAKRGRPPKTVSRSEKQYEGTKDAMGATDITECELINDVISVPQERKQIKQRRSKGVPISGPRRYSNRLAGLEPASATDLVVSKPSWQPLTNGPCDGIEESVTLSETEIMSTAEEAPQEEKQDLMTGQTSEDRPSSPPGFSLPFGSSWSDPCIEFAIKTLMGEIPVFDEGIAIEEYLQKQLSSVEAPNPSAAFANANVASDNQGLGPANVNGSVAYLQKHLSPVEAPCPSVASATVNIVSDSQVLDPAKVNGSVEYLQKQHSLVEGPCPSAASATVNVFSANKGLDLVKVSGSVELPNEQHLHVNNGGENVNNRGDRLPFESGCPSENGLPLDSLHPEPKARDP